MQNVCRMHSFERSQGLIYEVLTVVVGQLLSTDDSMHICFHKLLNQVNFVEGLVIPWLLDIEDTDDVLVIEMPK